MYSANNTLISPKIKRKPQNAENDRKILINSNLDEYHTLCDNKEGKKCLHRYRLLFLELV